MDLSCLLVLICRIYDIFFLSFTELLHWKVRIGFSIVHEITFFDILHVCII